jgi:glycosyltransferase involved in cell wall biosynthesis
MDEPMFSIIIPTLNEEKNLPVLLDDIKKQEFKNYEVVIVDGKSVDKTASVVESFQKQITNLYLITSKKRNICYQRNLGAQSSKGKYLIFLDADVQIYTNYLFAINKEIQRSSALFLTTYWLSDSRDAFDKLLAHIANHILEVLVLIGKQQATGYNFIVERELFFKAGMFDEKATFSEDHDLSIRILKQGVTLTTIRKYLLKWSYRRLKKDGRLPIIFKYSLATLNMLIFGKITDKNFGYPMGGDYFKSSQSKKLKLSKELTRYVAKIQESLKEAFYS